MRWSKPKTWVPQVSPQLRDLGMSNADGSAVPMSRKPGETWGTTSTFLFRFIPFTSPFVFGYVHFHSCAPRIILNANGGGLVIPNFIRALAVVCLISAFMLHAQTSGTDRPPIHLPTSKMLTVPSPGRIGSTNSFPATMVLSPDGHYAALLNDGYGTQETLARQSISVLNLDTNQITEFPDARFIDEAHQSFFIGLAFSSDGKHLYASVGSLTDPTGAKQGDLGNGIAVYSFSTGKVAPERF